MSDTPSSPPPRYRVICSAHVRQELIALMAKAKGVGLYQEVVDAMTVIGERFEVYPHFGQPLINTVHPDGTIWVVTVPPLVVHYAIYEERREVWVTTPIVPLPNSGL